MYQVYIIENDAGRYYIGCTKNLGTRLHRHNTNGIRSTKRKGPWRLVRKEQFGTKREALVREREIKSYKGNSLFRKLVNASSPSSSLV